MTDQELLRAYVQLQDAKSLGTFVCRYKDSVLRFVARLLGDDDIAQDVVQETFLRVAQYPSRLLKVDSCHTWLLRVARNIGMDHLRRVSRQRQHAEAVGRHSQGVALSGEAFAEPSARIEQQELQSQVRDAIDTLPHRQRELLLLRVQEKKSYKEIAEITGRKVGTIGWLVSVGLKALARELGPLVGAGAEDVQVGRLQGELS